MTAPAQRWSKLHHGIDPAGVPLLGPWLSLMWWLAAPLVRLRVPPTAVTVAGVLLAVDAVLLAGRYPWAAGVCVLASVVCDGLDGAVAVVGDAATRSGAIADAMADRISDVAMAAVIWRCGAPWELAATAGVLAVGIDAVRRVRRIPGRITVAERPTWTICVLLACLCATLGPADWPATVCAGVWVALAVLGTGQLLRTAPAPSPR
ncbi:MAG: CDP-alcohol phosphatidyltransferase family protein [Actinomycetota bacterium]|nr:CDP-alcohol phosphatidyltransferase family protein [Actinomycetota bacterium]